MLGQVWELRLPRNQKNVLLALADHADHNGENAFPGVELLAWKTDYSERQVQAILRELEAGADEAEDGRAGPVIEPMGPTTGGRGYATAYRLLLDNAPRKAPLAPRRHRWKGAKTSPFPRAASGKGEVPPAKRVKSGAEKGEVATAPQPSGTVRGEPSTRSVAAQPARGAGPDSQQRVENRGRGPRRAGAVLTDLFTGAGAAPLPGAPPADALHDRRTRFFAHVQELAWLGDTPPPVSVESPEVTRRHEAKILGELLERNSNAEVLGALTEARSHLGPGPPFSLRLLVARTESGTQLFRVFADRYFKRPSSAPPQEVLLAIRRAMTTATQGAA